MQTKPVVFFLLLYFVGLQVVFSQNDLISVDVNQCPLNDLLNDISDKHGVQFAFDNDYLSSIKVSIARKNVLIKELIKDISEEYGLEFKFLSGIYILFKPDTPLKKKEENHTSQNTAQKRIRENLEILFIGKVQNSDTGQPIEGCSILLGGKKHLTNRDGFFLFFLKKSKSEPIRIRHSLFQSVETTVKIQTGGIVDFYLKPISSNTPKAAIEFVKVDPKSFNGNQTEIGLETIIGFGTQRNCPIDFANNANIGVLLNRKYILFSGLPLSGGFFPNTLQKQNSSTVYNASTFYPNTNSYFSSIKVNACKSLFPRTPLSNNFCSTGLHVEKTLEGDQQNGGVLLLTPIHFDGAFNFNVRDDIKVYGTLRKSYVNTWKSNLGKSLLNPGLSISNDDRLIEGIIDETAFSYNNFNINVDYQMSDDERFEFYLSSNSTGNLLKTSFELNGEYLTNNEYDDSSFGMGAKWQKTHNQNWKSSISVGGSSWGETILSSYGKKGQYHLDSDENSISELYLNWDSYFMGNQHYAHLFGAGFINSQIDYGYNHFSLIPLVPNLHIDSISSKTSLSNIHFYYAPTIAIWEDFSLEAKIDNLFNTDNRRFYFQPSAKFNYCISDAINVELQTGRGVRPYYWSSRTDIELNTTPVIIANRNNKFESYVFGVLGATARTADLDARLELYQVYSNGAQVFFANGSNGAGKENIHYGEHKLSDLNTGVQLQVRYRTNWLEHYLVYAMQAEQNKINGINNAENLASLQVPIHRLKITELLYWGSWTAMLTGNIASGVGYYVPVVLPNAIGVERLNHFMQLDATLSRFFKVKDIEFDGGVVFLNVFNRQNQLDLSRFPLNKNLSSINQQSINSSLPFSTMLFLRINYH